MNKITYPFIKENIEAIINYHYPVINFSLVDFSFVLKYNTVISLDDLIKIVLVVKNNFSFFRSKHRFGAINVKNMLQYGIDAYIIRQGQMPPDFQNYTAPRKEITMEFSFFFKKKRN